MGKTCAGYHRFQALSYLHARIYSTESNMANRRQDPTPAQGDPTCHEKGTRHHHKRRRQARTTPTTHPRQPNRTIQSNRPNRRMGRLTLTGHPTPIPSSRSHSDPYREPEPLANRVTPPHWTPQRFPFPPRFRPHHNHSRHQIPTH